MTQVVSSPCTGVCTLGAHGFCQGCLRSGQEIAEWPLATDVRKQAILDALPERERALQQRASASQARQTAVR